MSILNVLKAGVTQSDVARLCGVSPQAVNQWRTKGVPAEHVRVICDTYKMRPHEIRPDLYAPGWKFPRK